MSEEIGSGRRAGYRVRIIRKNPHCPAEYSHVFDLPHAPSHDAAVREAMAEWDYCIRHSGVGIRQSVRSARLSMSDGLMQRN